MRIRERPGRSGLSLIEVLVSTVIFLVALAALSQLVTLGSDRALGARFKQEGTFHCQAKLAEFAGGVQPFGSQSETDYDKDNAWKWSATCTQITEQSPVLWQVQVTFKRDRPFAPPIVVVLGQMIVDPNDRGSTLDPPPQTADQESGSSSSSSSSSSGTGGS